MNVIATVEDLLEVAAGLVNYPAPKITLDKSDVTIMHSIARQVFKGTALTDRQFELVQEKLKAYKNQFDENCHFDDAVTNLRMPLREIDRSKYINLCTADDELPLKGFEHKLKWIKVRFPFSKKLIVLLDGISKRDGYHHDKGSHEHYFVFTEKNVWNVVKTFLDKNFVIDPILLRNYKILDDMYNNKHEYVPGVYNFKLKTVTEQSYNYITDLFGKPNEKNLALLKDKKDLLGLEYFDKIDLENSLKNYSILSQKIVNREASTLMVNSDNHTFDSLAHSLFELQRFPLLVILPENNSLDYLVNVHSSFRNFIDSASCSVMFRLDNINNSDFNNYIRDNNLNNALDKNTKIVYISTNKVPKPLLKSDWKGRAVLMMQSLRTTTNIAQYLNNFDLCLQYDNSMSQFMRFQRSSIQEI